MKIMKNIYDKKVVEESIEKQKCKEDKVKVEFNKVFFGFSENLSKGL